MALPAEEARRSAASVAASAALPSPSGGRVAQCAWQDRATRRQCREDRLGNKPIALHELLGEQIKPSAAGNCRIAAQHAGLWAQPARELPHAPSSPWSV